MEELKWFLNLICWFVLLLQDMVRFVLKNGDQSSNQGLFLCKLQKFPRLSIHLTLNNPICNTTLTTHKLNCRSTETNDILTSSCVQFRWFGYLNITNYNWIDLMSIAIIFNLCFVFFSSFAEFFNFYKFWVQ